MQNVMKIIFPCSLLFLLLRLDQAQIRRRSGADQAQTPSREHQNMGGALSYTSESHIKETGFLS